MFNVTSGKKACGGFKESKTTGEYLQRLKAKAMFCTAECVNTDIRLNSQGDLNLFRNAVRQKQVEDNCCSADIDTADLNINLISTLDLEGVTLLPAGQTLLNIPYGITIDPSGSLFGNDACGIDNFVRYMTIDPPCCFNECISIGVYTTNTQLETIRGCTTINGDIKFEDFEEQPDFSVFDCLTTINGNFDIRDNPGLYEIYGFKNLRIINGYFVVQSNTNLSTISGFDRIIMISTQLLIRNNNPSPNTLICATTKTNLTNAFSGTPDFTNTDVDMGC